MNDVFMLDPSRRMYIAVYVAPALDIGGRVCWEMSPAALRPVPASPEAPIFQAFAPSSASLNDMLPTWKRPPDPCGFRVARPWHIKVSGSGSKVRIHSSSETQHFLPSSLFYSSPIQGVGCVKSCVACFTLYGASGGRRSWWLASASRVVVITATYDVHLRKYTLVSDRLVTHCVIEGAPLAERYGGDFVMVVCCYSKSDAVISLCETSNEVIRAVV